MVGFYGFLGAIDGIGRRDVLRWMWVEIDSFGVLYRLGRLGGRPSILICGDRIGGRWSLFCWVCGDWMGASPFGIGPHSVLLLRYDSKEDKVFLAVVDETMSLALGTVMAAPCRQGFVLSLIEHFPLSR